MLLLLIGYSVQVCYLINQVILQAYEYNWNAFFGESKLGDRLQVMPA